MKNLFYIFSSFLIMACYSDRELEKTIFIPDSTYPELPKYSEWGYNTFGVYYDRTPFISTEKDTPFKIYVENDTTTFRFEGRQGDYFYYHEEYPMSLEFDFPDLSFENYEELVRLHDSTIQLSDDNCRLRINSAEISAWATELNGKMEFIRAQNLFVDKKLEKTILSGYFEFTAIFDGKPVNFSHGRFDLGIGAYNFYNFK